MLVMSRRNGLQLRRLRLGRCVVEEIASADLGSGEVLEQARLSQRRMNLNVEVISRSIGLRGRVMKDHDVRHGHAPEVLEANERLSKHSGEFLQLGRLELGNVGSGGARCDVGLVRVSREVRDERYGFPTRYEDASTVELLGCNDVLKEHTAGLGEMRSRRLGFDFDRSKNEVRRVDLAVRMGVTDADDVALVLEHQNVV